MDQKRTNPEGKWELSMKHLALHKYKLHLPKLNELRKPLAKDLNEQINPQTFCLQLLIPNDLFWKE